MVANINIANTIVSTIITLTLYDGWAMTKKPVSLEIPYTSQHGVTPDIHQDFRGNLQWTVAVTVSSIDNNSSTSHSSTSRLFSLEDQLSSADRTKMKVFGATTLLAVAADVHHHAPVLAVHHPVAQAIRAAPVIKVAAPAHHVPVKAGYVADDLAEQSPYTFTYTVLMTTKRLRPNFNAEESLDGESNVQGFHSVALPDVTHEGIAEEEPTMLKFKQNK